MIQWLLYTINVKKTRNYSFNFSASGSNVIIIVYNNKKIIAENILIVSSTDEDQFIKSDSTKIHLNKGINKLKIYFKKGGYGFKIFELKLWISLQ